MNTELSKIEEDWSNASKTYQESFIPFGDAFKVYNDLSKAILECNQK